MPAQRRTPGPSVEDEDEYARLQIPADNESNNRHHEEAVEQNQMKDTITVECYKLNEGSFNGTVNFVEAKIKVFQDGLGLDANLLSTVKINLNKCPKITFKLKSKINVGVSITNRWFEFTRIDHSKVFC